MDNSLSLAFSPCPNDTFMFDALVNRRIEVAGLDFNVSINDVETLNRKAFRLENDITKISFFSYGMVSDHYDLLSAGSALGNGVGPLFITKSFHSPLDLIKIKKVAIPGKHTTAYFLFRTFYPELNDIEEIVFSDIENAILSGHVDAGVIIHENRFTYEAKGLYKISDLGELWEMKTGLPIPLGGIAIRKTLSEEVKKKVNQVMRKSIEFAFNHPQISSDFVKSNAQEMSEEVRKKHIDLYVNNYSIDFGSTGVKAIDTMMTMAFDSGLISKVPEDYIVKG